MLSIPRTISRTVRVARAIHASGCEIQSMRASPLLLGVSGDG
jgi:hypothetical protein